MRKSHITTLLLLAPFVLMTASLQAQSCYQLVWQDEFDYTGKPDPDKWGYDIGGHGWGNNELQYYTDDAKNAYVEDGVLEIKAIKEPTNGSNYSSARLVTKNKGDWLYGKIVVKAQLPTGRGTWPAIWMLPTDWEYGGWPASGEIDIMEHVGYDQNKVHGTVHTDAFNHLKGTQKGGHQMVNTASEDFHEYSVEWDADKIDFFIDGNWYFSFANTDVDFREWPFDKRFHLILNIAIGGSWGGVQGVDDAIFPQSMKVDYVRVYQKSATARITGTNKVAANSKGLSFECTEIEGAKYHWSVIGKGSITSGQGTHKVTVDVEDENTRLKVSLNDHNCGDSIAYLNILISESTSMRDVGEASISPPNVYRLNSNGPLMVSSEHEIENFVLYDLTGREVPILSVVPKAGAYKLTIDPQRNSGIMILEMRIQSQRVFTKVLP